MQDCNGAHHFRISRSAIFLWVVLAFSLLPWIIIQSQNAPHPDLLWICEALGRLLDGRSMVEAAYDPNPPLSFLIYLPPVLATRLFGIPLDLSLFSYTLVTLSLSAISITVILRRWDFLTPHDIAITLGCFILINTIGASVWLGERDQLTGMMLVPFVLMQAALAFRLPYPEKLKWPLLLAGSLFILIRSFNTSVKFELRSIKLIFL